MPAEVPDSGTSCQPFWSTADPGLLFLNRPAHTAAGHSPPHLPEVPPAPAHLAHGPATRYELQLARTGQPLIAHPGRRAFRTPRARGTPDTAPRKDTFMTSRYPPLPENADRRAARSG